MTAKPAAPLLAVRPDVAASFSSEVEAAITGGVLRFTARKQLIARAGHLGIGAFEANLLIASVLHAVRPGVREEQSTDSGMALIVGIGLFGAAMWVLSQLM